MRGSMVCGNVQVWGHSPALPLRSWVTIGKFSKPLWCLSSLRCQMGVSDPKGRQHALKKTILPFPKRTNSNNSWWAILFQTDPALLLILHIDVNARRTLRNHL